MCNLYSLVTPQAEIRASFEVSIDENAARPPFRCDPIRPALLP